MDSLEFIDLRSPSDPVVESEQSEIKKDFVDQGLSSDTVIESEKIVDKEDFIGLTSSSDFVIGSVQHDVNVSLVRASDNNDETSSDQGKEEGELEEGQFVEDMDLGDDLVVAPPILNDDVSIDDSTKEVGSGNESRIERNGHNDVGNHNVFESRVKRPRLTYVDQEPSVEVVYKSLTRDSKRKLEELLQQWSQWHAQQKFVSSDPNETLESGKQTHFPAVQVGGERSSIVTFWVDNEGNSDQNKFIPLDGNSVPMYDRGFALGLTSDDGSNTDGKPDPGEAARCFNCGSYSHGLRDCKKPRDHAAVDSARKQHNSKRGQTSGARNATRYYQDSPGGKFDGLKPGALGSEVRKALCIGELDPPPWLQRMREIGYPPGYLDVDDEDQPSGITIYADDKTLGEENGEKLGTKNLKPKKKMAVEYPGINAPVPENADGRRWATLPEARHHSGSQYHTDHRRSQDYRDDGPPGVDNSPRYGGYNDPYNSPRGYPPAPILGRSLSDRGRWDPMGHSSGSPGIGPYSPAGFGSPDALLSPPSYHSPHAYGSRHNSSSDSSSRRIDRHDPHRSRR
ncbi:hypothetical protein ACHQM5_009051 [Ranunculus cassubicifolius]